MRNNANTVRLYMYSARKNEILETVDSTISEITFVKGDYTIDNMPDFGPYKKYEVPIKISSKNLINIKNYIIDGKTKEIDNGIQFEVTGSRIDIGIDFTIKANTSYVLYAECTEDAYIGGSLANNGVSTVWCSKSISKLIFKNSTDSNITKQLRVVDTTGTKGSTIKFAILEIGNETTGYQQYYNNVNYLYLDEPLRKLGENADYIDFKNQKIVRYIEEDNEGNLTALSVPKEEKIELPEILLRKGINNIEIQTSIKPSKIELEYYK